MLFSERGAKNRKREMSGLDGRENTGLRRWGLDGSRVEMLFSADEIFSDILPLGFFFLPLSSNSEAGSVLYQGNLSYSTQGKHYSYLSCKT